MNSALIGKEVIALLLAGALLLIAGPLNAFAQDARTAQLLDHTMARNVDRFTNYADQRTATFSGTDRTAYSWLSLGDVGAGTVKWRWYSPDGNLYQTGVVDIPQPNGDYWDAYSVWASISIAGHDTENQPGDWHVDIYLDDGQILTEQFTITSANIIPSLEVRGVNILDHAMASSVDESTNDVIQRNTKFSSTNEGAYSWLSLGDVGTSTVRWKWYSPDGDLYHSSSVKIPQADGGRGDVYDVWSYIPIADQDASNMTGNWHVDVSLDGQKILTEQFELAYSQFKPFVATSSKSRGEHKRSGGGKP
jgi:hypothetical protein